MADNILLPSSAPRAYILVLSQGSTGSVPIHAILSGRIQRTLSEVLEEAKADILKRIGKYPFDCLPAVHAVSTAAIEDIKKCIESIFFRYPQIFIRDYASLDIERKISLAKELSFQIEHGRFYIKNVSPSQRIHPIVYQPYGYGEVKILLEIAETITLDEDAFCELVETVFRTAAGKVSENLLNLLNGLGKKWMLPDDRIRSEIRNRQFLGEKVLDETLFIINIGEHAQYLPGKEIFSRLINKLSQTKGFGVLETTTDILLNRIPKELCFSPDSLQASGFLPVNLLQVFYKDGYRRYHRGELAVFGSQHLVCFHAFNMGSDPVIIVASHELWPEFAFLEQQQNKRKIESALTSALSSDGDIEAIDRIRISEPLPSYGIETKIGKPNREIQARNAERKKWEDQADTIHFETEKNHPLAKYGLNSLECGDNNNKNNYMERKPIVEQEVEATKKKAEVSKKTASHAHGTLEVCQNRMPFEEFIRQKAYGLYQKKSEIFVQQTKPEEMKQTPDLSEIAPWKSKEKSGPASKYLQDNYGYLLKRYNRELNRDLICLQDLKAHDETLWQGLYNEAKKTGTKPSEYVASKPQRTKEAVLDTDIGKLRELERETERLKQAMRRHGISRESLKNKPL